jgi:hypothetical protein
VRNYLFLFIICILSTPLSAQTASDEEKDRYNFTFAIQPMQWFNWGWRVDFEVRLGKDSPGWLQIGPSIYTVSLRNDNGEEPSYYYYYDRDHYKYHRWYSGTLFREPFTDMKGAGLDVNYKRFFEPGRMLYIATGLSYSKFRIKYWGWEWESYKEDGLQYNYYTLDYRNQHINRLGFNCFFGYQTPDDFAFVFDCFWGFAYRHSFADRNKPLFDENFLSFGHTGFVILTGVRIGFRF